MEHALACTDHTGESLRLADFIEGNVEPILADWVAFAESCGLAGKAMDTNALRDHAQEMLTVIVRDLRTPQSEAEQSDKAKGKSDSPDSAPETAAEVHGSGRAESGFTVGEMVSEYRALRASVIRLWTKTNGTLTGDDFEDLMRFNEAIDQSLAESITRFTVNVDESRDTFVAILGHDLRTPLGAVIMASQFVLDEGHLAEPSLGLVTRILSSSRRMNGMVGDLLDFTRGRLGSGIPIVREQVDIGNVVRQAVDESTAANPESALVLTLSGALDGCWDASRLGQVMSNLIGNAIQHGAPNAPISVSVQGEADDVVIRVHNTGAPIDPAEIHDLFGPFKLKKRTASSGSESDHLGLGLYIADRVAVAHGGSISVRSSAEAGTLFTVRLPR